MNEENENKMNEAAELVKIPGLEEGTLPADAVTIVSGKPMTTSLKVAEFFGKLHKNVIQSIESLECSQNFGRLNFQLTEYLWKNNLGKEVKSPMYTITKDGFTFLAMGFTGANAARFKESYIEAFNRMEAQIRSSMTREEEARMLEFIQMFDARILALEEKSQKTTRSEICRNARRSRRKFYKVTEEMRDALIKGKGSRTVKQYAKKLNVSEFTLYGIYNNSSIKIRAVTFDKFAPVFEKYNVVIKKGVAKSAKPLLDKEASIPVSFPLCETSRHFSAALNMLLKEHHTTIEELIAKHNLNEKAIMSSYSGSYNWTLPRIEAVCNALQVPVAHALDLGFLRTQKLKEEKEKLLARMKEIDTDIAEQEGF